MSGAHDPREGVLSVALIGASVGKGWRFEDLPSRAGLAGSIRTEFHELYRFDKTPVLEDLLGRKIGVPDVVVLKECAAYFPMDPGVARKLMTGWIERCRAAGVVPVPATVAPVLRASPSRGLRGILARRIRRGPGPSGRLEGLLAYNDWVREYARGEGLDVLDLERCLRVDGRDRSLRPDFHSGDGLHLNQAAYSILDREFGRVVAEGLRHPAPRRSL